MRTFPKTLAEDEEAMNIVALQSGHGLLELQLKGQLKIPVEGQLKIRERDEKMDGPL